ncbi:hypothetical protein [Candidatus Allofournierella merdipullorum]|uniref:hypothetical protein n=1 Tax=Candidatus Allofournierella merdipullorum TaxID=2838595 RepID=UPI002A8C02B0|nr:hypothetical protein [Candidatus Fournierella merdipullorum]
MNDIYEALNHVSMDLDAYAPVPLEEGEKQRQVNRLLAAEQKERPALRVHRRRWTVLAAAAALTACLAVGAGAAHSWSGDFAAFLGLREADSLGDMSKGLGLSQTLPGGTVTLEGVLGDDYCIYVPFTVEAPEGQVLDGTLDYGFDNCTLYSDASDGMVQHMEMLPDDDPTDNKLRFVMMASSSKPLRGEMAEATVWNLFSYPTEPGRLHDEDAVVPGRFEFSFRLDYEDRSVLVCDRNTDVGLSWPLARLELSPVSVYLELDGLPENEPNPAFDTSIVLIGADGSRQELVSDWDYEQTGEGIPGLSFSQDEKAVRMLLQAIDPAQYTAVEVNGVQFPIG